MLNISVNEALRTRGDAAVSVIEKEFRQMIDKKVWEPVDVKGLPWEEKQRISLSMFLKEKFLASGEFEKLKARLVAGGDQQDRELYDDLSAPTVATSSVFTLLSIAAYETGKITVIDISGIPQRGYDHRAGGTHEAGQEYVEHYDQTGTSLLGVRRSQGMHRGATRQSTVWVCGVGRAMVRELESESA